VSTRRPFRTCSAELSGPGYGVSLRDAYPATEVVVTSPIRRDREMRFALWEDYGQPEGYEDANDTAVLILAHVGEREQRLR
jgi:hypothetical protein